MTTILLTAAEEDSERILSYLEDSKLRYLHTPLEVYKPLQNNDSVAETLDNLADFETVVYGHKRNAIFFVEQLKAYGSVNDLQNCLNLAANDKIFEYLESHGITAVTSPHGNRPIDLVELMLRIQRLGETLYPCGTLGSEHFPGLLEELDVPVTELPLFDLKGPGETVLNGYRSEVKAEEPDTVVFHSRRSVTRTLTAFPALDYQSMNVISADIGITEKLKEKDVPVDAEGEGSWSSVEELV